ncbi:hypothetical protein SDC9_152428 [bioreactor metagenome]|uniref:Uncharacterized protein n=1 Tax=bioreactor metagenome TaxID=1076179 RepID=A0A645ET22_9ZZZZ
MSELFIVIFATIGLGLYQFLKYILYNSPKAYIGQIIFIILILIILLKHFYLKIRFRKVLKKLQVDYFDFKFYKTCNNLFNKISYVISAFLYNTISEYKFTIKDFSINKNYNRDNSDTEYYLKLRLRWYSYIRFTSTRMKIALRKADNFAFSQQLSILEKSFTPEEKSIYLKFQSDVNNLSVSKISIYSLSNIENYKDINYIYKYNLVKIYNNNIQLDQNIKNYNFMAKKFEQYNNDIRSYKRLK